MNGSEIRGNYEESPVRASTAKRRNSFFEFLAVVHEHWRNWLILVFLFCVFLVIEFGATPFERHISVEESKDSSFPHMEETVPGYMVPVFAVIVPFFFFLSYHLSVGRDIEEFHDLVFGSLMCIAMTAVTTGALKGYVGRPRPDFLERCFGKPFKLPIKTEKLDCTSDNEGEIVEGRKSFPSGHSSWTMCAMTFMSLFLLGKLNVFNGHRRIWSFVVAMMPMAFGGFVGLSRYNDYRHHWSDVMTGFAIGMFFATVVYLSYYPSPFKKQGTSIPLHKIYDKKLPTYNSCDERSSIPVATEMVKLSMSPQSV